MDGTRLTLILPSGDSLHVGATEESAIAPAPGVVILLLDLAWLASPKLRSVARDRPQGAPARE